MCEQGGVSPAGMGAGEGVAMEQEQFPQVLLGLLQCPMLGASWECPDFPGKQASPDPLTSC